MASFKSYKVVAGISRDMRDKLADGVIEVIDNKEPFWVENDLFNGTMPMGQWNIIIGHIINDCLLDELADTNQYEVKMALLEPQFLRSIFDILFKDRKKIKDKDEKESFIVGNQRAYRWSY